MVKEANVESGESGSQSTCHRMEQTNINKPFIEQSSSRISIATRVAHGPSVLAKNGINRSCEAILTHWSAIVIVANEITFFTSDIRLGRVGNSFVEPQPRKSDSRHCQESRAWFTISVARCLLKSQNITLLIVSSHHPIWSMMKHGTGKWWHN